MARIEAPSSASDKRTLARGKACWAAARKGVWESDGAAKENGRGFGWRPGRVMLEGPGREGVRRAVGWDGEVVFSSFSSRTVGEGGDSVRVADVALDEGPGGGEGLGG